jgi:integrase
VLLRDFLATFLHGHVQGRLRNAHHYAQYASRWEAALGDKPLRGIVAGDVARYVRQRQGDGLAPATINRELAFLRRAFNVAIADDLAEKNPISRQGVKLFRENNQRVRFLTDEEEAGLAAELPAADWALVAVALHTGLRQGEQFGLRWEDVDFGTGILTVPRAKSGEARRVPMNDTVRTLLGALPSRLRST